MPSLYEKYGGLEALSGFVKTFYELVVSDSDLKKYFRHTDIPTLVSHQIKFLSSIMGGPEHRNDASIEAVHLGLGITKEDFDKMTDILVAVLKYNNMDSRDINKIAGVYKSYCEQIVDPKCLEAIRKETVIK